MNEAQIRAFFKVYLYLLQRNGHCEVNLPQADFEAMRDYIKSGNYTTTESNAENVLNVHIEGRVIKIGGIEMDYEKLLADKKEGKISSDMFLVIDNDGGYWACNNALLSGEERKKKADEYKKEYGAPGGYVDIVDVLNAAGIESEWC